MLNISFLRERDGTLVWSADRSRADSEGLHDSEVPAASRHRGDVGATGELDGVSAAVSSATVALARNGQ